MTCRRQIPQVLTLLLLALACPASGSAAVRVRPPHIELSIDSSGRVVAALGGGSANKVGIVRLEDDGELDRSFGGDGIIGPRKSAEPAALALLPSGKVLAAMQFLEGPPLLRRFFANGHIDRNFGRAGATRLPIVPDDRLLVQPDGHIVILVKVVCPSYSCGYTFHYLKIQRYSSSGRLVSRKTYGGELWEFEAVGMDKRGRLVIAGSDEDLGYHSFARFRPSGKLDRSLGGSEGLKVYEGSLYESKPGDEILPDVSALAVQPEGKFVLASGEVATEIRRRNYDGSVDTGFGTNGAAVCAPEAPYPQPRPKPFLVLAAADDGTILAAGGRGACGLVRYLPHGTPDPMFGNAGAVDLEALGLPRPRKMAIGPDGEITVAGWDAQTRTVKVARFAADGHLDSGFGVAGVVSLAGF